MVLKPKNFPKHGLSVTGEPSISIWIGNWKFKKF